MFIDIWGKKIWYEIYGAECNDTLLYLHGGPGASCLDFVNQAKALSGKMKVVIFDQLGVLRSEAIAGDECYSMEYQIEMIEEMRKFLGIQKWSILGHSYGGMLAVLYAYAHPNSIHKIILECPSLCFEDSAKSTAEYLSEHISSLNNKQAIELCEKIKFSDYQDKTEVVWDLSALLGYVTDMELRFYLHGISFEEYQMSMDTSDITDEMWSKGERHLKKLLETQPMPEDSSQKRTLMTDNLLPLIPKITAPMLLINGRYDPACTKSQIAYIMNHAKDVTQAIFEDSGHFPRIEEAKKYTDTVWNFLGYE
ncbi:MAG: alpha/beta fold hydrolase [Oscillospiraceae bacterium]|nr:alpha/beta fold hydrolase [Oscillospiraceae bacterium]